MPARRKLEVEIKLRVKDLAEIRRRLAAAGARRVSKVRELNLLFDTTRRQLARQGRLLRVRQEDGRALLTYKGPSARGGRYKVREEVETTVADPDRLQAILGALGLRPWFRYQKHRTSYRLPGLGGLAIALDETPIGAFVELEGPKEVIDQAARRLGYGPAHYLTSTYRGLYLQHCRLRGVKPGDMLFPGKKK